ncbi:alpha/beta fold hydrolase [Roseibium aggregatum]|uniref:Alpha/beta fold hydrolase n=1 Tax=Roseibium aggregatum TaxID=187304 RepID=A0A926S5A7_9HYPH|nr:alpha/beta fold hydrolase [Roseibium aggregatum]MBD1545242.1 alpha/beta fold hydrolase [Roseibium aggregatum]
MSGRALKVEFEGAQGARLAARLDLPAGKIRAFALFAHCFTCSKDIAAARNIAGPLTKEAIAVLRFDFTGLGGSGGDFASTGFSTNMEDLKRAAAYLKDHFEAPQLLIGHSLGGAAALSVAADLPEVRAVATIGAPGDAAHVLKSFHGDLETIRYNGQGTIDLAGRSFKIRREFLDELEEHALHEKVRHLKKALLVLHAPRDEVVGIDNATEIFVAARHPKSFVSLDNADHLLSRPEDAAYAARVIAAWASGYLDPSEKPETAPEAGHVEVMETGLGKYQAMIASGKHRLIADEPEGVGGLDSGPSPYDYLSAALGACTVMTLRMYADHKNLPVTKISATVRHGKVHAADCKDCGEDVRQNGGRIDRFERRIAIEGDLDAATRARLLEIADKCPVHKTLTSGAAIVTKASG